MKNISGYIRILFLGALAFFVISCGGGGGSGIASSGGSSAFPAEPPISITAENSDEVVAEAFVGFAGNDSPEVAARSSRSQPSQISGLSSQIKMFGELVQFPNLTGTANRTDPLDCESGSGSVTSPDDVSPSATSLTFSVQLSNCLADGTIQNGSATVTVALPLGSGATTMNANNFSVVDAQGSATFNGILILTQTPFPNEGFDREEIDGTDAVITLISNGRMITIGEMLARTDVYTFPGEERSTASFVANSSALGGSFRFETTQLAYQRLVDDYPYQGQVVITGASSSVRVTSQGDGSLSGQALIETDEDGDGTYESSASLTWQELENSLLQ